MERPTSQPAVKREPQDEAESSSTREPPQTQGKPRTNKSDKVVLEIDDDIGTAFQADRPKAMALTHCLEYVELKHIRQTVRKDEAFQTIRVGCQKLFRRQADALEEYGAQRRLEDMAHAVTPADRPYILKRCDTTWKKNLSDARKELQEDVDRARTYLDDDLRRDSEVEGFNRYILGPRKERLERLQRDVAFHGRLILDLKELGV